MGDSLTSAQGVKQVVKYDYLFIDHIIINVLLSLPKGMNVGKTLGYGEKNEIYGENTYKEFVEIYEFFYNKSVKSVSSTYGGGDKKKEILQKAAKRCMEKCMKQSKEQRKKFNGGARRGRRQDQNTHHQLQEEPVGEPVEEEQLVNQVINDMSNAENPNTFTGYLYGIFQKIKFKAFIVFFLVASHLLYQTMDDIERYKMKYMVDSYEFQTFLNMVPGATEGEVGQLLAYNTEVEVNNTNFFKNQEAQKELLKWLKKREHIFSPDRAVERIKEHLGLSDDKLPIEVALDELMTSEYSLPKSILFKQCYLGNETQAAALEPAAQAAQAAAVEAANETADTAQANKAIVKYDKKKVVTCLEESLEIKDKFRNLERYGVMIMYLMDSILPQNLGQDIKDFLSETGQAVLEYEATYNDKISKTLSIKIAVNILYYIVDVLNNMKARSDMIEKDDTVAFDPMVFEYGLPGTFARVIYNSLHSVFNLNSEHEQILMRYLKGHFAEKARIEEIRQMKHNTRSNLIGQSLSIVKKTFSGDDTFITNSLESLSNLQGETYGTFSKYKTYEGFFRLFEIIMTPVKKEDEKGRLKEIKDQLESIGDSAGKHLLIGKTKTMITGGKRSSKRTRKTKK